MICHNLEEETMIKLSLIVPVYNCENTIQITLLSILPQLKDNTELIIVDDGSSDKSLEIIEKCIRNKKFVKLIKKKNEGVVSARLTGLKKSIGEFIWFIDGGDKIISNSIDIILKKINGNIDIIFFNYEERINSKSIIIKQSKNTDNVKSLLTGKIVPSLWSKIYKKKLLVQCNFKQDYDLVLGEDLILNLEYLTLAKTELFLDSILYTYIRDENSITLSNNHTDTIIKVISKIQNFMIKKNLFSKYKDEVEYLIFCQLIINYIIYNKCSKEYEKLYKEYKKRTIKLARNKYLRNKYLFLFLAKIKVYIAKYKNK